MSTYAKLYKFSELSEQVQEKLLEKEVQSAWECGLLTEDISDALKYELTEKHNFPEDTKVWWDLGYCQGDYVGWDASISGEDMVKFITPWLRTIPGLQHFVTEWGLYITYKTYGNYGNMHIDVECGDSDETEEQEEARMQLQRALCDEVYDLSHELRHFGYECIEEEEKYLQDELRANTENLYTRYGELVPESETLEVESAE